MTDQPVVKIMRLHPDRDSDVELPRYMTSQAAGMDISAAVEQSLVIPSGGIVLVPTGFAIALPRGYEAQIRPRSGLAVKHGITVVNSPGTIDADYRGEVKVGLVNLATASYTIQRGERIAQMIIQPVSHAQMQEVAVLEETRRSSGGFGSTGA